MKGSHWDDISVGRLNLYCATVEPSKLDSIDKHALIRAFQAAARTVIYNGEEVAVELAAEVLTPEEFYNEIYLKNVDVRKRLDKWQLDNLVN